MSDTGASGVAQDPCRGPLPLAPLAGTTTRVSTAAARRDPFRLYWISQTASLLGDQLTLFALPWLVAAQGGGPFATGGLVALGFVPTLVFGFLAGALADRWPRRPVLIGCELAGFALVASIPLAALWGGAGLWQILLVALCAGLGRTLFHPAATAFMTEIVPEERLLGANARLTATESATEVVGPGLAGLLVGLIGASATLGFDAASFLVSALCLAAIRVGGTRRARTEVASGHEGFWAGLRHVRTEASLWWSTAMVAGLNLFVGIWGALAILFLQRTLGLSGLEAGLVFAANGLGSVLASIACGRLEQRLGIERLLVAGITVAGAGQVMFALAPGFGVAAAGLGLVGVGVVCVIVPAVTMRQLRTPVALLGRVQAACQTAIFGGAALGALAGGVIGTLIGFRGGLLVGAIGILVVALIGWAGPLGRAPRGGGPTPAEPAGTAACPPLEPHPEV